MTSEQKLREAFDMGWKMAANWSLSDHLLADMESPAYMIERDGLLLTITPPAAAPAPAQSFDEVWSSIDWDQWRMRSIHDLVQMIHSKTAPAPAVPQINYHPGTWYEVKTREELEAFFLSRLPAIREAAREHGYAIGLHGSLRRDMDLIAVPWRDGASDKDKLAHAIAMAAVGITRDGGYKWEAKPAGRVATSLACAWTTWYGEAGAGHIDLSVMPAAPSQPVTLTDEATKNAARYVWLRDVHIGNNPEYINLNPVKNGGLDAAIDALREKEQAK